MKYIATSDSGLILASISNKAYSSFVRALCYARYAIQRRAREYGYDITEGLAYEVQGKFIVEFIDTFGLIHKLAICEVE